VHHQYQQHRRQNCRRYQRSTIPAANLPLVSRTPAANFATIFASVVDTGKRFATGVNDAGGKLPPVSATPAQIATGVINTCGEQREQLSDCCQLKMNLKKNISLYANSTTQWCQKEIIQIFLIEDFLHPELPISP
jgi:hypothetical protein